MGRTFVFDCSIFDWKLLHLLLKETHEMHDRFRFLALGRNETEVSFELEAGNVYDAEAAFLQFPCKGSDGYDSHAVTAT